MQRMAQRVGLESRPGRHQSWCAEPTGLVNEGEREKGCSRIENEKAWGVMFMTKTTTRMDCIA